MELDIWGSPLVVDGKVYIGDEDGDVRHLRGGQDYEKLIAKHNMGAPVYARPCSPTARSTS